MNIAEKLEKNKNYFKYFSNAINSGVNFFEYQFIFGDSSSYQLFYVEKYKCENSDEGLTKLIIPYLCYTSYSFNSNEFETLFETIKQELKNNIYWNYKTVDSNKEKLLENIKYFPINKIKHFEFKENKWNHKNKDISEILK